MFQEAVFSTFIASLKAEINNVTTLEDEADRRWHRDFRNHYLNQLQTLTTGLGEETPKLIHFLAMLKLHYQSTAEIEKLIAEFLKYCNYSKSESLDRVIS